MTNFKGSKFIIQLDIGKENILLDLIRMIELVTLLGGPYLDIRNIFREVEINIEKRWPPSKRRGWERYKRKC